MSPCDCTGAWLQQEDSDVLECSIFNSTEGSSEGLGTLLNIPDLKVIGALGILNGLTFFFFMALLGAVFFWSYMCDAKGKCPIITVTAGVVFGYANTIVDIVTTGVLTLEDCDSLPAIFFVVFKVVILFLNGCAGYQVLHYGYSVFATKLKERK